MELIEGRIPKGITCDYSSRCKFKVSACNNQGCRVCDGKTVDYPVSCAIARGFVIIDRSESSPLKK